MGAADASPAGDDAFEIDAFLDDGAGTTACAFAAGGASALWAEAACLLAAAPAAIKKYDKLYQFIANLRICYWLHINK